MKPHRHSRFTSVNSLLLHGLVLALAVAATGAPSSVSLAGRWRFSLDRDDLGVRERWWTRSLSGQVTLPGVLAAQGIGDDISTNTPWTGGIVDKSWFTAPEYAPYRRPGNVKVPFWLQPEKYYAGAAWYQREVEIPKDWQGKHAVLFLERAHWETRVWVDDRFVGTNVSLSTPHEYDLGLLTPGRHTLTIRVDNRLVIDVGENSHSVSDHTQGNWNGLVGELSLRPRAPVWIEDLQVYPHPADKSVTVVGRMGNATGQPGRGALKLVVEEAVERGAFIPRPVNRFEVAWDAAGGTFRHEVRLAGEPKLWDEFHPHLYRCEARLEEFDEGRTVLFGFREMTTAGTQFLVNGRKTFIRGTLECAIFPRTGYTPTDLDAWRKVMRAARAHGLNNLRFHSHCPPEAAFVAADELGMYLHVECGTWANQSTTLGDGKPVDRWVYEEADRILKAYGNHPSFVMLLYGNEPGGRNHVAYLRKWVEHYKAADPRRLYSSGAGWPQIPENQFHVTPDPRIQAWGAGLKSRINARPPETATDYRDYIAARSVPVISHEIGQWCVYPNFDEIPKYTGYLKPKNFEIFRDRLEANGMGRLARPFLLASGKLQTLCYKEDIESALRTPGMGGFQLLDLHDFPGQGTALVGVLDPFWEEKGYVTAREFSRFCNATVPLARLKKRVFTTAETLEAEVEVAHFGPAPINALGRWRVETTAGRLVGSGEWPARFIPVDNGTQLGRVSLALHSAPAPCKCRLVISLEETVAAQQTAAPARYENDWDIWVYPERGNDTPAGDVLVTDRFDAAARARLATGGKVLLTLPGRQVRNFDTAPVKLGFSSIFWNTAWTGRQAPTTLGILCDPNHPALAQFPTESHSNWQWWYLIRRAGALRLDLLPPRTDPIVRVIDDWFTARPLGLIVEGRVGRGKIMICGFDLTREADDPVSQQMRASLLAYMRSARFRPKTRFTAEQVQSLIAPTQNTAAGGLRGLKADSEQEGYEADRAVDGDPETMWHTAWGALAPGFPHELVLELEAERTLTGMTVLPRQDGNHNGWIKDYEVWASADGRSWGEPVARGRFEADANRKTVTFAAPVRARFLKLRVLSGHANGPWASVAELGLLHAQ